LGWEFVAFEAIIFAFDGLLMDTESTMVASWRAEWARHGLDLDLSTFWPGHGGDVTEYRYAQLAARVGPGFDLAASRAWRVAYRDRLHESLDLSPGMRDWLQAAQSSGLRLAIASSSPREWVRAHLSRVGALSWFSVLATGDEVSGHKPDPGVYELALKRLGVSPTAAVAVEDTPHGVAAAQAAGLPAVAIPNPFIAPADLAAADLTLSSAADLPLAEVLRRLAKPDHPHR
jgi:HAD superfamily hydrolase (TIGR01509 family)